MQEWKPARETEFKAFLGLGIENLSNNSQHYKLSGNEFGRKIKNNFLTFWICGLVSMVLFLIGLIGLLFGSWRIEEIMILFCILGSLVSIPSLIFYFIILHKLWSTVHPSIARTTPGKAVGFCFIPFFNFYWVFVCMYGLGLDLNTTLQRESIKNQKINVGLNLTICILFCCGIIPFLGYITSLASGIINFISLKQMIDSAIAINDSRDMKEA